MRVGTSQILEVNAVAVVLVSRPQTPGGALVEDEVGHVGGRHEVGVVLAILEGVLLRGVLVRGELVVVVLLLRGHEGLTGGGRGVAGLARVVALGGQLGGGRVAGSVLDLRVLVGVRLLSGLPELVPVACAVLYIAGLLGVRP